MTSYNCTIVDEDEYNNEYYLKQLLNIKSYKIHQLKNECCICLTNESTHIFVGCGHYCICKNCNNIYINNMCPKCKVISKRIKVYKNNNDN